MASPSRRISRQDVQSIYPLLGIQKGMLFHDLSSPEHQPYFRQVSFRIEGRLDARLCERTWNELMARHESLRSCFDYENTSQLLRLVWNQRTVEFDCCDLSRADEPARIAAMDGYRGRDRKRGFDLRRDPLMRVKLFQLGGSRCEMVWSWPHIILDGWSGSVLLDEFARIYSDVAAGRAPSLPPAPDHREYMDWLASRDAGAARDYWAGLLDGYETLATIPKPSAALDQCGYDPAEHAFELSHSQAAALRELAARNGVTQSTVLHCLWGILLGRYNDTDDVVFGAVVSGRPPEVAGMERMVGLFLNTIPVRVRAEPSAAFAALLQDVQRSAIESMRHDHLPLAEIQAVSSMKRGLFDHVLAFENYPRSVPAAGAEFAASSVETYEHSNYDFGVLILPGTPFRILFKYNRSAYSSARMERLEVHLRTLVGQVLRNDRVLLGDLNILAPSERTVLVGPPAPYPPDSTLAGLWDARVAASPESTALILDQRSWSYREVNQRANQVAHALRRRLALRLEDRVGVLMERSERRVIALLGILKAGGTYCPNATACPEESLRFLLEDSGCRAVIADAAGVQRVNTVRAGLALDIAESSAEPVHDPPPAGRASSLAYLMYTSGSTGRPKGVLIENGGFVNMILDQIRGFGITPADRVLQFASSSFDASLSEIFMALAAGATLVLLPEEARSDGVLFQDYMHRQRITVVTLPPSYLRALDRPAFPDLRVLITAGEPPNLDDVRHYAPRLRYFNAYGPTETSVCASFHEVAPRDADSAVVPIGRPVANSSIRLLDRRLRPVPVGVPGEICFEGPGLARGYLNNPELTALKFVRAPSADGALPSSGGALPSSGGALPSSGGALPSSGGALPSSGGALPSSGGALLYRTGDLGCWCENGEIVCLGRADDQVKVRGFRIELGEIESVLRGYPGIAQAAAAVDAPPGVSSQLVAYYVAPGPIDPHSLRDYLARRLPPHMVPSPLVPVPEIPRTTAGKVDRRALPDPAAALRSSASGSPGPLDDVQQAIRAAFEEVLGRNPIGIHDSFLDLGGDSLKAILVVGRLLRRGWSLDLRDLLRLGSIARLAGAVRVRRPDSPAATGLAPLTPIQHRFFGQHSPAHWRRLTHAILLRAAAGLEEAPLAAAVNALWLHHDTLRMRYRVEAGGVVQTLAPAAGACFQTLDLSRESDAWDRLAAHANALHEGFSLATGPLFKAVLCRMPDADYALLVAHHLVVDAVSWRILLEDLSDAFEQALERRPISLPPTTSSYSQWANALAAWSRAESLMREKAYWSAVGSRPVEPVPTDFPAAPHHYGETGVLAVKVPAPPGADVAPCDMQAVLLTAISRTLHHWSGCQSTRVLLAGHGRVPLDPDVDVSRTVGWFTANYPVLVSAAGAADVAGELAAARRMLASVPSQGAGYGVLQYLTPPHMKTDLIPGPEPEIGLNYLGPMGEAPAGPFAISGRLPNASVGMLERAQKLEFDAVLDALCLVVSVRYCPKLHRPATIAEICRNLHHELAVAWSAGLAGSPGRLELERK